MLKNNDFALIENTDFNIEFTLLDSNEEPIEIIGKDEILFEILKNGKRVQLEEFDSSSFLFDLSDFPAGKYVYRVLANNKPVQVGRIEILPQIKS